MHECSKRGSGKLGSWGCGLCGGFAIASSEFFSPIITPRWRPLLMADDDDGVGHANEKVLLDVADDVDDVDVADVVAVVAGDDDGKCDGPESSTVQKASAVAPTKAVGVICWSLL